MQLNYLFFGYIRISGQHGLQLSLGQGRIGFRLTQERGKQPILDFYSPCKKVEGAN
jgi:hypothetical protein